MRESRELCYDAGSKRYRDLSSSVRSTIFSGMELPIFHDNLKSSGSWVAALAAEREAWGTAPAEARDRVQARCLEELRRQWPADLAEISEERLREAADWIGDQARDREQPFTRERLLELHRILTGREQGLRVSKATPLTAMHDPTPAILVPRMLDNAFDWFGTDSFAELHPVEKASIVYLRLLDLAPFAMATGPAAQLAASFYVEREGFPPLVLFTDEPSVARYQQALEAAFRMLTQPLVELFADSLRRAIRLGIEDEA